MQSISDSSLPGGLYLVATPIGNPRDITLRALDVLGRAHVIACEDTRVTGRLLHAHQLSTPLITYHDHNGANQRPKILARLQAGEAVALVSDGGTPLISDPGYKLVQACREGCVPLWSIPGPCAPMGALCVSGLPPDRFFFQGFLPPRDGARAQTLQALARLPATLIFFEAPHRLVACLQTMRDVLGDRMASVVRELTKTYEEVKPGALSTLIEHYLEVPPRGEIVVCVQGFDPRALSGESLEGKCRASWSQWGHLSVRDAVARLSQEIGASKREIYQAVLKVRQEKGGKKDAF